MPRAQKRGGGALDAESADLLAIARDNKAYDKLIKEIVKARESAHDRERTAQAAEAKLAEAESRFEKAQVKAAAALERAIKLTREERDHADHELSVGQQNVDAGRKQYDNDMRVLKDDRARVHDKLQDADSIQKAGEEDAAKADEAGKAIVIRAEKLQTMEANLERREAQIIQREAAWDAKIEAFKAA